VDTVERFQGQQGDVGARFVPLGDPDAIRDEEEFLLSLNRFNVLVARAPAKFVLLVSQDVVDQLAHDETTLVDSRLLKTFVNSYCGQREALDLGFIDNGQVVVRQGQMRWR